MTYLIVFVAGVAVGAFVTAYRMWENWISRESKPLVIKIDAALIHAIDDEMIRAWLDQRGLTWMPKGLEYMKGKVKKP